MSASRPTSGETGREILLHAPLRNWMRALDGGRTTTNWLGRITAIGLQNLALAGDVGIELTRHSLYELLAWGAGPEPAPNDDTTEAMYDAVDEALDGMATATVDSTRELRHVSEEVTDAIESGLVCQQTAVATIAASLGSPWVEDGSAVEPVRIDVD